MPSLYCRATPSRSERSKKKSYGVRLRESHPLPRTQRVGHPRKGWATRPLPRTQRVGHPPSARSCGAANTKSCLRRKNFETSGAPPAVPRHLGDWAEEFQLPMLLTVCIEAGRSTLTHTSRTGLPPVSRKWMSGQAAALATTKDRTPFANLIVPHSLRDLTLPGARRPPSPLDFYLSWMSPDFYSCHFL